MELENELKEERRQKEDALHQKELESQNCKKAEQKIAELEQELHNLKQKK